MAELFGRLKSTLAIPGDYSSMGRASSHNCSFASFK